MAKIGKTELVKAVANRTHGTNESPLTQGDVAKALDGTLTEVANLLAQGHEVTLPGFGTFRTTLASGIGPTGAAYTTNVVRFKAGSTLKGAVNA